MYKAYNKILNLGMSDEDIKTLESMWNQKFRFYHTEEHLLDVIDKIKKLPNQYNYPHINDDERKILYEVALFHDCVYNPWSKTNEQDSIDFYTKVVENPKEVVIKLIMDTSLRTRPKEKFSKIFWDIDNSILQSDIPTLLEYEKKIMREFQFIDYSMYKEARLEFLNSCLGHFWNDDNLKFLITYVENYRPKVGFYPGSFNPVHKGHINVMEKSEEIFDKVIIGMGVNPEKEERDNKAIEEVRESIQGRQLVEYSGMTTEIIEKLSEYVDVTLIRGIRNATDLAYENDQLRFMEDIKGDKVEVIYLPCDQEFNHISSSRIRKLINGGYENEVGRYLP